MKYSKDNLLKSVRYAKVADVVAVVLEDSKFYTLKEVDALVEEFLNIQKPTPKKKGKVN